MDLTGTITIDRLAGTCTVDLNLTGADELNHELLAAFFTRRTVLLTPTSDGDNLSARFLIDDAKAFEAAVHNLDNRKRKQDGRPSLEEEAATAKAASDRRAKVDADAKMSEADRAKAAKEREDRIEKLAAQEIADRTIKASQDKPKAPEPTKVQ